MAGRRRAARIVLVVAVVAVAVAVAALAVLRRGPGRPAGRAPVALDAGPLPVGIPDDARQEVVDHPPTGPGRVIEPDQLPALVPGHAAGTLVLHAVDADTATVRTALAWAAHLDLIEPRPGRARVTGRIGPVTEAELAGVLGRGVEGLSARARPEPRAGVVLALDLVDASAAQVIAALAAALDRELVLAAPVEASFDVRLGRGPAARALALVADGLGLTRAEQAGVTWLAPAGAAPLDPTLRARPGPTVALAVAGLTAGETYALLAGAGAKVGGGARCDAGRPVDLWLRAAPLGLALALVAAQSGQPPVPGERCAVAAVTGTTRAASLGGVVRIGARARAAVRLEPGGLTLVGAGDRLGEARVEPIGPASLTLSGGPEGGRQVLRVRSPLDELPGPVALAEVLAGGRLAATVVAGARSSAVFALPDGRWVRLDERDGAIRIEPGRVRYRAGAGEVVVPLRAAR